MPDAPAFPDDVVRAVCAHMNDDHRADALLICRTLGGQPGADDVRTTGVDGAALHLTATVGGAQVPVQVPFARPVTERRELRAAVVELAERARTAGG